MTDSILWPEVAIRGQRKQLNMLLSSGMLTEDARALCRMRMLALGDDHAGLAMLAGDIQLGVPVLDLPRAVTYDEPSAGKPGKEKSMSGSNRGKTTIASVAKLLGCSVEEARIKLGHDAKRTVTISIPADRVEALDAFLAGQSDEGDRTLQGYLTSALMYEVGEVEGEDEVIVNEAVASLG